MKRSQYFTLVISLTLIIAFIAKPFVVSATEQIQTGTTITATGQMCDAVGTNCTTSLQFTFDPAGGPVTGSFSGTGYIPLIEGAGTTFVTNGTLSGTFDGGDGGTIGGTLSGKTTSTLSVPSLPDNVNTQNFNGTWQGNLNADGTGKGTVITTGSGTWSVTYPADEFKAGLIVPTATSFEVVAATIELDPQARAFIASAPTLDDATLAILNQDSVIIARDANNNFFAINNQGQSLPLPQTVNSFFQTNNSFAILDNEKLIASSEHGSIRGTINGGGDFVFLNKIPGDLKNRDYALLATTCLPTQSICHPELKVNSTASSIYLTGGALSSGTEAECNLESSSLGMFDISSNWSSEHASIRGTINGGGWFINNPIPAREAGNSNISLVYPSPIEIQQSVGDPPFLGMQVENSGNAVIILQIQTGSPAYQAGLVIGDFILSVSGSQVDSKNTFARIIGQHVAGDQVEMGIMQNGVSKTVIVTLGQLLPAVIITPSAEITVSDNTRLVIDIGFNGVTGILVLEDQAHIREPVTGSEVDVPAGMAVIIAPGVPIGELIPVSASESNPWWDSALPVIPLQQPQQTLEPLPQSTPSTFPQFVPVFPNLASMLLYIGLFAVCCGGVVVLLMVVVILLVKKRKRRSV